MVACLISSVAAANFRRHKEWMRFLSALVALSVLSLSVLPLGGCAAEPEGADPAADDDLRMTATGVSIAPTG